MLPGKQEEEKGDRYQGDEIGPDNHPTSKGSVTTIPACKHCSNSTGRDGTFQKKNLLVDKRLAGRDRKICCYHGCKEKFNADDKKKKWQKPGYFDRAEHEADCYPDQQVQGKIYDREKMGKNI
jgi:hypothetical protein